MASEIHHILCPSCGASFDIEAQALGAHGRTVACSECHYQWFEQPHIPHVESKDLEEDPRDTILASADAPPIHNLTLEAETQAVREKVSFFTTQIFMIPIVAGLLFTGLFFGRNDIIRFAPGTEALYKMLGITTYNLSAFRFQKPEWQISENTAHKTITISGHVLNTSDRLLAAPTVQVTLKGRGVCKTPTWTDQIFNRTQGDENLCTLSKWTFRLREGRLFSGQTSSFNMTYPIGLSQQPQEVLLKFIGSESS